MARINITGGAGQQTPVGPKNLKVDEKSASRPYHATGGSGVFDIHSSYRWTLSPTSARKDVPRLILTEWNGKATAVLSKLFRAFSQGTEALAQGTENLQGLLDPRVDNPIKGTYIAEKTGLSYELPAIGMGDFTDQVANEYGYGDQNSPFKNITSSIKNVFQQRLSMSAAGGSPGSFIGSSLKAALSETASLATGISSIIYGNVSPTEVQFFTGTGVQSYTFTIDLLNTVSVDEVAANREFVKTLMHQNMHEKSNYIISRAPCIYSAELKGRKWWPAVSIAPSVQNLGTFLNIDGVPTPEAYRVTIVMNELIPQFRRVERLYQDHDIPLSAFTDPGDICKEVKQGLDNVGTAAEQIGQKIGFGG